MIDAERVAFVAELCLLCIALALVVVGVAAHRVPRVRVAIERANEADRHRSARR